MNSWETYLRRKNQESILRKAGLPIPKPRVNTRFITLDGAPLQTWLDCYAVAEALGINYKAAYNKLYMAAREGRLESRLMKHKRTQRRQWRWKR
jgi:hypothetical protein